IHSDCRTGSGICSRAGHRSQPVGGWQRCAGGRSARKGRRDAKTAEAPQVAATQVTEAPKAEAPKYVDRPALVEPKTETPKAAQSNTEPDKPVAQTAALTPKAEKPRRTRYWTEGRIISELHRHGIYWEFSKL